MTKTAFSEPSPVLEAARRVDSNATAHDTIRELLALVEDTAAYIAKRARGQTTATPERRKLREDMERALSAYLQATTNGTEARSYATSPETLVTLMLAQSRVSEPAQTEAA